MSRIICFVNADITTIYQIYLPDDIIKRVSEEKFLDNTGVSPRSRNLFNHIISRGKQEGVLVEKSIRIAISKEKTAALEDNDVESVQVTVSESL